MPNAPKVNASAFCARLVLLLREYPFSMQLSMSQWAMFTICTMVYRHRMQMYTGRGVNCRLEHVSTSSPAYGNERFDKYVLVIEPLYRLRRLLSACEIRLFAGVLRKNNHSLLNRSLPGS